MLAYSPTLFRSGLGYDEVYKSILDSLVAAYGDGLVNAEEGTIAYVECQSIAKALSDAWISRERFINQFDFSKVSYFLDRFEQIYRLPYDSSLSDDERRARLQELRSRIGKKINSSSIISILKGLLGDVFIQTLDGSTPYSISNDPYITMIAFLPIRIWKSNKINEFDFDYLRFRADNILNDILPAQMQFATGMWQTADLAQSTISITTGSTSIVGTGTVFLTPDPITGVAPLQPGEVLEITDIDGIRRDIIIDSVVSNTLAIATENSTFTANNTWRRFGFYLASSEYDVDHPNLDHSFLSA